MVLWFKSTIEASHTQSLLKHMLNNSYCPLLQRKTERIGRFFFALVIQLKQQGVRNDTNSSESTVSVIGRLSIWELWHSNL